MKTIKGPAIFLAQFAGDEAPFNSLDGIAAWAAGLGFKGVQMPSWDGRLFDLDQAADSKAYCEDLQATLDKHGIVLTELSSQLVAVHPAYDMMFDGFAPESVRGNPGARQQWAVDQMMKAAKASQNLGLTEHATFSGALAWPYFYPWPQRPAGLVETAFDELAKRWTPILDAFDEAGVDCCYEIHPGEDLHDGVTFEMQHIDIYHERIKMFHVKDAELNPTGRQGVYGGYQGWVDRAGRFRSLGDGQVDFAGIFSKFAAYDFAGWAVLEWECCLKHPEDGAREGAQFISDHIIRVTERAFDDFADAGTDDAANRAALGID